MSIWQREYSSPCSRSLLHPTLADEPLDLVAACRAIMRPGEALRCGRGNGKCAYMLLIAVRLASSKLWDLP
uniref:Uncharacterized protein n=1 Tax=Zea mays TaxID=4577 RepID=A0A804Q603_MAIZE